MKLSNEELTKKINELVIKWKGKKPKVNDWLDPNFREWRIDQTRYWTYRDWLKNSAEKIEKKAEIDVYSEEFWNK